MRERDHIFGDHALKIGSAERSRKAPYRAQDRIAEDPSNAIFQRSWWLDAVCPGGWSEATVVRNGEVVARLPYRLRRSMGLTAICMPPLTQTLGPSLKPPTKTKLSNQLSGQKALMSELIDQLPPFDLFDQNFHHSVTNWLPFYWQGFEQTTRYTYQIDNLTDLDEIWSKFGEGARRAIRKARKQRLKIESTDDLEQFLDLHDLTFERQGIGAPHGRDLHRRIDTACKDRECRKILIARDDLGRVHAGLYLIWDDDSAYYLLAGADPQLRNSGAASLLIWEAIQFSAHVTKVFDFEGSMIEPIERFFRGFGARQIPYSSIRKENRRFALANTIRTQHSRLTRSPGWPANGRRMNNR